MQVVGKVARSDRIYRRIYDTCEQQSDPYAAVYFHVWFVPIYTKYLVQKKTLDGPSVLHILPDQSSTLHTLPDSYRFFSSLPHRRGEKKTIETSVRTRQA